MTGRCCELYSHLVPNTKSVLFCIFWFCHRNENPINFHIYLCDEYLLFSDDDKMSILISSFNFLFLSSFSLYAHSSLPIQMYSNFWLAFGTKVRPFSLILMYSSMAIKYLFVFCYQFTFDCRIAGISSKKHGLTSTRNRTNR